MYLPAKKIKKKKTLPLHPPALLPKLCGPICARLCLFWPGMPPGIFAWILLCRQVSA